MEMEEEDFRKHLAAAGWTGQGRNNFVKTSSGRKYRFHLSRAGAKFEIWTRTNKKWAHFASAYWRDIEIGSNGSILGLTRCGMGDPRGSVEVKP